MSQALVRNSCSPAVEDFRALAEYKHGMLRRLNNDGYHCNRRLFGFSSDCQIVETVWCVKLFAKINACLGTDLFWTDSKSASPEKIVTDSLLWILQIFPNDHWEINRLILSGKTSMGLMQMFPLKTTCATGQVPQRKRTVVQQPRTIKCSCFRFIRNLSHGRISVLSR